MKSMHIKVISAIILGSVVLIPYPEVQAVDDDKNISLRRAERRQERRGDRHDRREDRRDEREDRHEERHDERHEHRGVRR